MFFDRTLFEFSKVLRLRSWLEASGERMPESKKRWIHGLPFDVAELTRSWRHNNRDVSTFRSLAVQSLATGAFVRSSILMVIRQRMDDDAVRM
jgi:hypothetical protein